MRREPRPRSEEMEGMVAEPVETPMPVPVPAPAPATHDFDLFVVHAAADAAFVRESLLPALDLPPARVMLVDELPLGGLVAAEIDRGVSRSRYTVAVLSPAYLEDRWADFGAQLATHLSLKDPRVIPLRLVDCELPVRLEARVALDFTSRDRWAWETARLRALLHSSAIAASLPYPYRHKRDRRRRVFGVFGGVTAGASMVIAGLLLWPKHPSLPPPPDDMVRFAAANIRPGVFAAGSRPEACSNLTANEDCAVLDHPENVEPVHVAAFDLDRDEVTNEEFATWLNANIDLWKVTPYGVVTTRREPTIPLILTKKCGDGLTITPPENRAQVTAEGAHWPVVCVSWYGANEYCRAHDKRLPLDVEWELAAKGTEGRAFPWGDELPRQDGVAFALRSGTAVHPRPVGTSAQDVSPDGVHDLGGNAAEWVEDRRGSPGEKTLRGGGFGSMEPCYLLSSGCKHIPANEAGKDTGFRCARSVIERPHTEKWMK